MPYRRILADNILTLRRLENISQEELAFRTEISKETIILIERGQANVRLDTLEKLAVYTGLTLSELFTENFFNPQKSNFDMVEEIRVWKNGYAFPVCPKCSGLIGRKYQSFCDECGQMLKWKGFSRAKVRRT